MSEIKVFTKVGENTYGMDNVTGDKYLRNISSPLHTSNVQVGAKDEHGNISTYNELLEIEPEWQPPKIDWMPDDYFNYFDYNRIKNNIFFLNRFMRFLFLPFEIEDMGENKDDESMIYAREFNAIEDNLQIINQKTYRFEIEEKKIWHPNRATPTYKDFNRIESICLMLYKQAKVDYDAMQSLAFTLGGEKGIKV